MIIMKPMAKNSHLRRYKQLTAVFFMLAVLLMSFSLLDKHKTTLYMIGDSTMADKSVNAYPETGWGMPFHYFFDSTIKVDNRAKNGRSTRTFITEGLWKSVMATLKQGDYVFIEFGHNDEVPTKGSYTKPQDFTKNLQKFVADTRSKGAHPILMTPVARRHFDTTDGNVTLIDTHKAYGALVRDIARNQQVPLIDLQTESMALLRKLGPEKSAFLYNQLQPGEHPHYPNGVVDNTHFNELGARKMAEIVLRDIITLKLPIALHLSPPR